MTGSKRLWPVYDSRGNWTALDAWLDTDGKQTGEWLPTEGRTPNAANEYASIDPDTALSPPDPVALAYDANGNLTGDPLAPNVGSVSPPAGQTYVYDLANRVVEVRRTQDGQTLQKMAYDALGRRVCTAAYVDAATGRGMDQQQFNDWINSHPEWFQLEDLVSNMRHWFEKAGCD